MWFKNLCLFQLAESTTCTGAQLEEQLQEHPLGHCPGATAQTQGWVPVLSDGGLVEGFDRQLFLALGEKQRLLPAAVVSQALAERVEAHTQQRGFKPGRKQRMDMRDEITARLLPQAFVVQRGWRAWLDTERGWLIVDAASMNQAEKLVDQLREDAASLPRILLPDPAVGMQSTLSEWLAQGHAPGRLALDDEAELQGAEPTRALIRYTRHPVGGAEELRKHLDAGKRVTKLGLVWDDRISFVLTDTLQIKKLRLLETPDDDTDDAETEADAALAFEADMRLMTGLLGELLDELATHLGLRAAETSAA